MSSPWLRRLSALGRELGTGLLHLFYPDSCLSCGLPLPVEQTHFCAPCRAALFTDPDLCCPHCAGRVGPYATPDGHCGGCRHEGFAFDGSVRLGPYRGALGAIVLRMKHHRGEGLAELLGGCWAAQAEARFRALDIEVVVPVPLHWWRRWRRGYNQSTALAYGLARRLGLPLQPRWLRRIRNTRMQPSLSPAGRKENVKGAFAVRPGVRLDGRKILLVDDVMTTGATANECARALKRAGAARVVVAALTRAQG